MEEIIEEQIDLRDYLRVIRKRRWTIASVFFVILFTVAIYSFTATPVYEATTRLIIEKENPNVVSIEEVMAVDSSGTDYYQTQYKIIESRTVAREVIKRLNLVESQEFSQKPPDDLISRLRQTIYGTFASLIESFTSMLRSDEDMTTVPSEDEIALDSVLVSGFIERIKVSPIRNSRLLDVRFQAKDPLLAKRIANTLADAYIDQNLETKLDAVKDAVRWLNSRIDEERKNVEQAEHALLRYKEEYGIVTDFSSDVEQVTAQKLAQLNAQVVDAESKRVEAETRYQQAMALMDSPDMLDSIPAVLNNELVGEIKSMEVGLYKRMSELSEKYGRKHPKMQAIELELKTLRKRKAQEINRVVNSLKNEYRVAIAKEKSLKNSFAEQKKESLALNQKAVRYGVLKREAESARDMYELLIRRFKETTLTENMRTGNIRILDRAELPESSVKPRKKLNIFLAAVVGLVFGLGLAFFFEYLDNTIKIPEDVKNHLKVPYLGPVPAFVVEEDKEAGEDRGVDLMTVTSPKSTASESYRGIRTSILLSSAESEPQVVMVSSAGPGEGKTITTANLAVTMAQSGSKVIMLDCDLRRPKLHKVFGVSRDQGISNILVGKGDPKSIIINTQIDNLDIIPCGPIPPNPSEMLGSARMAGLIAALRKRYDRVIIDTPPATAVTDAVILSKIADGVVVVVRSGETAREIVKNGIGQFENIGANILGVVLNGVDMGRDSYYYQYYYYYYGEEGKKKTGSHRKKRSTSGYHGREA